MRFSQLLYSTAALAFTFLVNLRINLHHLRVRLALLLLITSQDSHVLLEVSLVAPVIL